MDKLAPFHTPRIRISLRIRITILVSIVICVSLVTSDLMITYWLDGQTRESISEKAMLLSRISAQSNEVIDGLAGRRPAADIQSYAEGLRRTSGVEFVVILNMHNKRLSHPKPALVGQSFVGGDEAAVFRGASYTSVAAGTLGVSLRGFSPVFDHDGRQIGASVVGILLSDVDNMVGGVRRRILFGLLIGLLVGAVGAVLLAAQIRRILLGMEPTEIAQVFQERNALVQSVREGIIAVNRQLRITVVNEEASRLLTMAGISGRLIGRLVDELLPGSQLARVLETRLPEFDQEQTINGLAILTNRVPVIVGSEVVGVVATFRDKTEIRTLAEQLIGVRHYVDALRAQTHEFMNKLHVILGMIHLKQFQKLETYIYDITEHFSDELGYVLQRIHDPVIAGFLLARFSSAREHGITMLLSSDSDLPELGEGKIVHDIITILGNLLENAFEATAANGQQEIRVAICLDNDQLTISVADSGPGIPLENQDRLFERGFSTKGGNRGYGLFHTAESIRNRQGSLTVTVGATGGSVFSVIMPLVLED